MNAIEPNLGPTLWFALLWTVCCLGFLVLAGMFPLATRPGGTKSALGATLVAGNALLWLLLALGTALYGYSQLRWTTLVVVGGLVLLFAPGLFQVWPEAWRDRTAGLALLLGLMAGALALLGWIGPAHWLRTS